MVFVLCKIALNVEAMYDEKTNFGNDLSFSLHHHLVTGSESFLTNEMPLLLLLNCSISSSLSICIKFWRCDRFIVFVRVHCPNRAVPNDFNLTYVNKLSFHIINLHERVLRKFLHQQFNSNSTRFHSIYSMI